MNVLARLQRGQEQMNESQTESEVKMKECQETVNQTLVTVHGDELRGCQRPCDCLYLTETLLNVETDGTTEPVPLSAPSTTHHNQVSLDLHPITSQRKHAVLSTVRCQESNSALPPQSN